MKRNRSTRTVSQIMRIPLHLLASREEGEQQGHRGEAEQEHGRQPNLKIHGGPCSVNVDNEHKRKHTLSCPHARWRSQKAFPAPARNGFLNRRNQNEFRLQRELPPSGCHCKMPEGSCKMQGDRKNAAR